MGFKLINTYTINPNLEGYRIVVGIISQQSYMMLKQDFTSLKKQTPITKEDLLGFKIKYDIDAKHIIAYGDTSISEDLADRIIPKSGNGFKCFGIVNMNRTDSKIHAENPIIHEDSLASWHCLMSFLGKPTKIILFKQ